MLAQMCRANVPLPAALRLLARDLERGRLRHAANQMADDVEAGATLAEAYARQPELPDLYRALIEAGLATSDLPGILDEIARHAADREQIKARMQKALFHPLLSATSVLVIGVGLFAFADPMFGRFADDVVSSLHARGAGSSAWRFAPWVLLLSVSIAVVSVLVWAWRRSPLDGGTGPRRFAFRLPFSGYLRACAAKSGFASTLGLLIQRGLPLPQALTLAAAATDDLAVRQQIEAMRLKALDGENLAASIATGGLISPAMQWFVESGEQNNAPAVGLLDVARIYRQRLERATDRLCALVAPAALLSVGLIVLAFVLGNFVPVYSGFINLFLP
jgi:type II secretory pathway component PulF